MCLRSCHTQPHHTASLLLLQWLITGSLHWLILHLLRDFPCQMVLPTELPGAPLPPLLLFPRPSHT